MITNREKYSKPSRSTCSWSLGGAATLAQRQRNPCSRSADAIDLPMNGALDETTSQEREGIASVDGKGCILRFDPFPFTGVVVSDLQGSNGLTEKESP